MVFLLHPSEVSENDIASFLSAYREHCEVSSGFTCCVLRQTCPHSLLCTFCPSSTIGHSRCRSALAISNGGPALAELLVHDGKVSWHDGTHTYMCDCVCTCSSQSPTEFCECTTICGVVKMKGLLFTKRVHNISAFCSDGQNEYVQPLPLPKLVALCECQEFIAHIAVCDHLLYQSIVDTLIPNVLKPIPGTYVR